MFANLFQNYKHLVRSTSRTIIYALLPDEVQWSRSSLFLIAYLIFYVVLLAVLHKSY